MRDCLIVIDRDGTLIKKHDYLGKEDDWKSKVELIEKTIFLLNSLDTIYTNPLKIVFTNQTGVALGYFSENRVCEINDYVSKLLKEQKILIDYWLYSPEADSDYAKKQGVIKNKYIKPISTRKPNPLFLISKIKSLNLSLNSFDTLIVIGDSDDDKQLADNINAKFISV